LPRTCKERIIAQNLIAEQAFSDLKEALRGYIENPDTLVVHGPYFSKAPPGAMALGGNSSSHMYGGTK
jgi:hypothetical protein